MFKNLKKIKKTKGTISKCFEVASFSPSLALMILPTHY